MKATLFLAFDTAREADEKWAKKGIKPPLYGIPFSVKGNFFIPGYDCCIGLAKWLDQPKSEECSFVTYLRNLGAIPFVITNIPQGLLSFSCSNSVYGTTCNPHDITRTPGGSSGGEGALLAAGAVPFGIGSDLAGSLRIPAAFCGFVTLKPTQDRLVVTGTHGGIPGRGRLGLSFGFLTHSVDEQVALLDLIIGKSEYRAMVPLSVPAVLNMEVMLSSKKLKIGYFDDDGFCTPIPALIGEAKSTHIFNSVRRCVLETVEHLKCEGHELVRFTVPDINLMVNIFFKLLMPDGGGYICSLYENDVVDPFMKQFVMMLKVPRCIRWLASIILNPISPQLATLCKSYVSDLEDLRYTQEQCDEYRKTFIAYWKMLDIDALVCPAFPVPAVPHQYSSKLGMTAVATGIFNLIDFPAGVVPVGKVTKKDDEELLNEAVFPVGFNIALKQMRDAAMNSAGLPLAVQVVTLPFEEEMCLRVMSEVERIWKK
uniref:Amidase domain-containing protein n=1 Tax=Heterorhabditis bacteriophora TaxID=37862 RepID=A0A1I7X4T8_HETBA